MKRPAFQFYPADWRNNANLGRCSPAARGVWVDILCVLHDSDEYGIVRWPLVDLANAAHAPMKLIRELVEKNVLKGGDKQVEQPYIYTPRSGRRDGPPVTLVHIQAGPAWYSSRMVKDEHVRTIRGESTRFSEESSDEPKHIPKASPKHPFGDGSSSSSSSSSSLNTEDMGSARKRASRTRFPDDFAPNDSGLKAATDAGLNVQAELQRFRNHHEATGSLMASWQAAWRTWVGKAVEFGHGKPAKAVNGNTDWLVATGFPNIAEAQNCHCHIGNANLFRNGKRIGVEP